ncbi:MAG TPA: sulfatase-like hydrolase/transferase [Gemmatimonadales bacterium]|jgi:phosphoglycerol transferase MdoB-like AlkP superfamily enzyme
MIQRLRFCIACFAMWMAFFTLIRAAFVLYHHAEAARAGVVTIAGIFFYGARMDMAAACFPAAIAFVLTGLLSGLAPKSAARVITVVSLALMVSFLILATIDLELFRDWGFRIDAAVLRYLNTPREMLASAGAAPIALLVGILAGLVAVVCVAYFRWWWPAMAAWQPLSILPSAATAVMCGLLTWGLYYPSRGGIQKMPMTQSTVYFSRNAFANQAAINMAWNFFDSVWWHTYRAGNPYRVLSTADATRTADSLLASGTTSTLHLLRVARPNVIVIIWESMTSKIVERLGGVAGVTPNIDSLIHEGVLFDHFYATGDRSPEGLTGVIAGYPAQTTTEIIQHPRKSATLPGLPRDLARAGYSSTFYYGGDPEFTNIKSFVLQAGFGRMVTKDAFAPGDRQSDWGADDHVVLGRLAREIPAMRRPFFVTLFTLSSHEPFIVPMPTVIAGRDERSLFLNSHVYTDRSIGDFIRRAKTQPWWDSTLIVITGDHGHRVPELDSLQSIHRWDTFSIPMLWIGGALAARDTVIHQPGVQTDFPATLLRQLGLDASGYHWSRNLFARDVKPWAWFTFTDGFGWINDADGALAWDDVGKRMIAQRGPIGPADIHSGQALLQRLVDDYNSR